MDVSELRSALRLRTSVTERVRQFRDDRIAKIRDNKHSRCVGRRASKTILHCIPLESFSRAVRYDVLKYRWEHKRSSRDCHRRWLDVRINLDGS